MFNYNQFNLTEPKRIYLSRPNGNKIGQLNGINTARLHVYLQDIWKIEFEVDKYINQKLNKYYNVLNPLMEFYVPEIGWFRIDTPPTEEQDGEHVYKTFTANGIETQLNDIDIRLFHINCADTVSYEMYEENLDARGIPQRSIQMYISDESDDPTSANYWMLGALNILEHYYLKDKGWSVGHIDSNISVKKGRRFEISAATLYNILTNDMSVAYECLFTFDRFNKKINAFSIEEVGKSLNIECSFRNLINNATISPQENELYTKITVQGANENTNISPVNFGSNDLIDLSYVMTSSMFNQNFIDKYFDWMDYRESRRQEYADTLREYLTYENEISLIRTQMPVDIVKTEWNAYSLDELKIELNKFEILQKNLEDLNTIDGVLQIEDTNDYAWYLSIKDVIIPAINQEIARQEAGSVQEYEPYDYETQWELFGIDGLNIRRANIQTKVDTAESAGFNVPWSEDLDTSVTESVHNKKYEEYLQNLQYLDEIDARLEELNKKVLDLENKISELDNKRTEIVDSVSIENEQFGFLPDEISTINALIRGTDFQDSTIEVLDTSDIQDIMQSADDLYKAAKKELEIHCRPQTRIDISLDNMYHIPLFKNKANEIEIGDFMYLELDGGTKSKQRIIGMDLELINFNNIDLNFTFSDAVNAYGKDDDFRFLLGNNSSISKNNISTEVQKYISDLAYSAADAFFANYISNGGNLVGSGGNVFVNGVSSEDAIKIADALNGMLQGTMTLDELKVKLAQIDTLEADSAFINYLETVFFKAETGEFSELSATVANIKNAIIGTSATETGIFVNLTAENATLSEALIKSLMAQYITVADLKAGNIITDTVNVLSADGSFAIVGNTMQFKDKDGNLRIQIGRDANDNFTFTLYDETGEGVLIDSTGIHASAISDGLIVNQMIGDGQVSKSKLDFNIVEADEDGKVDISVIKIDGEDFYAKYTTMESTVNGLAQKVEQNTTYILYIDTPNGTRMRPEGLTLNAVLFHNSQNVTVDYDSSCFTWTRQSADSYGDIYWNDTHKEGTKTITITSNDLYKEATFKCTFEYEDVVAVASI